MPSFWYLEENKGNPAELETFLTAAELRNRWIGALDLEIEQLVKYTDELPAFVVSKQYNSPAGHKVYAGRFSSLSSSEYHIAPGNSFWDLPALSNVYFLQSYVELIEVSRPKFLIPPNINSAAKGDIDKAIAISLVSFNKLQRENDARNGRLDTDEKLKAELEAARQGAGKADIAGLKDVLADYGALRFILPLILDGESKEKIAWVLHEQGYSEVQIAALLHAKATPIGKAGAQTYAKRLLKKGRAAQQVNHT